jgi:PAS domain S-box-containing protein
MESELRILLVQDAAADAGVIEEALRSADWTTHLRRVCTHEEFVRQIDEFAPDLILSEYHFTHWSGLDVLQLARQMRPQVPFIFVTHALGDDVAVRCLKAGADDYVLIDQLDDLTFAVEAALESAAKRHHELQWALIADSVDDLVDVLDGEGRRLYSSPGYRLLVDDVRALGGQSFFDLVHPDDRHRASEALAAALETGTTQRAEFRIFARDHQARFVECLFNVLRDPRSPEPRVAAVSRIISKRKRAEDALRENVKHFRALVENISDAISLINPYGIVLYTSRSTRRVLGYYINEFVGRNLFELIHPDDLSQAIRHFNNLRQRNYSTSHMLFRMRHKDGTWRWMEGVGNNLMSEPSVRAIVFNYRDITNRKQAEEELKQSEERYREMFKKNQAIKLLIDPLNARIIDANSAAAEFYGYPIEDLKEMRITDINTLPADEVFAEMNKAANEQRTYFNFVHRLSTGETRDVDVYSSPITVKGKKLLYSIIHDVTEQRKAAQELAEQKERLLVTLRSIGEGVITTDTQGHVVLMNKVAEHLTGWTQQEAVGLTVEQILDLRHEATREAVDNAVVQVLTAHQLVSRLRPSLLVSRSGAECHMVESAAPILTEEGKFIGVVLVIRDISDRLKMEEEILKTRNIESIGLLAGGIAHDFNNILSAILGNITLAKLKIESGSQEKITEFLSSSERAALRAKHLTQQLLTFSRGGSPVKKTASIGELLRESAEFSLTGSSVRCEFSIAPDLWSVDVDEGQMSQVINNLVINAQQAMPNGGTITVRADNLTLERDQERLGLSSDVRRFVRISIQDQGTGIRKEHLSRIFDPYFTTKETGSGLGLATSYSIIRNHQGAIKVESEPGQGTTFIMYLPASNGSPAPAEKLTAGGHHVRKRVLVMDDEEAIRVMTAHMLQHLGYEALVSRNGEEAIGLYESAQTSGQPIDLIIMDLTIPGGMGGRETVRRLKAINPAIKVVVSSGYSHDPVMADFRKYGFDNILPKPYHLEDLSRILRSLFNHHG